MERQISWTKECPITLFPDKFKEKSQSLVSLASILTLTRPGFFFSTFGTGGWGGASDAPKNTKATEQQ